MILIDTSVWLAALRDLSGTAARRLAVHVGSTQLVNAPFVVTELLQGARDEKEWMALSAKLAQIPTLDLPASLWADAARIFYDLQRLGITPRSTIDCYLAQLSSAWFIEQHFCIVTATSRRLLASVPWHTSVSIHVRRLNHDH